MTNGLNRGVCFLVACGLATALTACSGSAEEDDASASQQAIVNGTAVTLGANSFVRLLTRDCTATLLSNQWAITANHCQSQIGDTVVMDGQTRTVAHVVPHPDVLFDVDIALLMLSKPLAVGGSMAFQRVLRPTGVPAGTHIRCFGYGRVLDAAGTTSQLRLAELKTVGGGSDLYSLFPNDMGQFPALGDAGGACLDDQGQAIGLMRTFQFFPTPPGHETEMISSHYYAAWAMERSKWRCMSNADCTTNPFAAFRVCNTTTHSCEEPVKSQ